MPTDVEFKASAALRELLATGKVVRIIVATSLCKGIPPEFTGDVGLDLGYNLVTPMPDLTVDADGIRATMQFGRVYSKVEIPWLALRACGVLQQAAPAPKRALPKGWRVIQGGKGE